MKITIGITTYNRIDFLKLCLQSILVQGDHDLEILIGNDYVTSPISNEILEIDDARIQIFNYPKNIGELDNLNYLVTQATGDYFIWMADDDEFHPDCFKNVYRILNQYPGIDLLIPETFSGLDFKEMCQNYSGEVKRIDKIEILMNYLKFEINVQSVYMFFKIELIKTRLIGVTHLVPQNLFYSDTAFMFKAVARAQNIMYFDFPCCLFRTHDESRSKSTILTMDHLVTQFALARFIDIELKAQGPAQIELIKYLIKMWFFDHFTAIETRRLSKGGSILKTLYYFTYFHLKLFSLRSIIGLNSILEIEYFLTTHKLFTFVKSVIKFRFFNDSITLRAYDQTP